MDLIFELSDVFYKGSDKRLIFEDESYFVGEAITNRVAGIVFLNLQKSIYNLSIESKNALHCIYLNNIQQLNIFKYNLKYISRLLKGVDFKYALLKGAFLSTKLYKDGERTSNDLDILVERKNVTQLQKKLINDGFVQGRYSYNKKCIVPATRREIIHSSMNYGETVPFIKINDGNIVTVDINFSTDYKTSEGGIISCFLNNAIEIMQNDYSFYTLNNVDFFIHLCCHLYKEATVYNYLQVKKDLMLYKFSDINIFLGNFLSEIFIENLISQVNKYSLHKELYYTLQNTSIIYPRLNSMSGFEYLKNNLVPNDLSFMKQIIYPEQKKIMSFDMDFIDWFNCKDRIRLLKEIKN